MKRTNMMVLCGIEGRYGNPIYRRVYVNEDGQYFVRWKGNIVNVTNDILDGMFIRG